MVAYSNSSYPTAFSFYVYECLENSTISVDMKLLLDHYIPLYPFSLGIYHREPMSWQLFNIQAKQKAFIQNTKYRFGLLDPIFFCSFLENKSLFVALGIYVSTSHSSNLQTAASSVTISSISMQIEGRHNT